MECPPRSEESSGVERMVFGITTTEPPTLAGVSFRPVVAIAACYFSAPRASETDPIEALRWEVGEVHDELGLSSSSEDLKTRQNPAKIAGMLQANDLDRPIHQEL